MAHDRRVGGIRCTEVLELLSDYLDGELERSIVTQIETHLRGCDWCEKFGGEFQVLVTHLREELGEADSLPGEVVERLNRRLDAEIE